MSPFLDGDCLNSGNPILAAAPGVGEALAEAVGFATWT